jgi:DNA-cytosine methyltransferase
MNVLSLFDGMSCGQIALRRANIPYERYYASEIDKYAIQVTQQNYPKTIQLGDVTTISSRSLPRIDLLMGGSPCQGFSWAGKHLNFDDPRSKLFFEFVRLLRECNPRYFLFENVKMTKQNERIINNYLKCTPLKINSSLVSAQNRERLYWTNIPNVSIPIDRQIVLKTILVDGFADREKSFAIDASYYKKGDLNQYLRKSRRQCIFLYGIELGRRLRDGKFLSRNYSEGYRIYSVSGKAATLTARSKGGLSKYSGLYGIEKDGRIYYRHLLPIECERLQTVPDNYTYSVSNTQRYKMLGNGWTVDVIAHLLKGLK